MKTKITILMVVVMIIISANFNSVLGQATQGVNAINPGSYLGTSNNNDVVFKGAGTESMRINFNNEFLGIGKVNPQYNLSVAQHISIDTNIVYPTIASPIGCYMLNDTTILHNNGKANLFGGFMSGVSITTGANNAFFGRSAGYNMKSGYFNTFAGDSAGYTDTSGSRNVFIGHLSGFNTSGSGMIFNTFVGDNSGLKNSTGTGNTYVGQSAGLGMSTGTGVGMGNTNSFFGYMADSNIRAGIANCYFGVQAGEFNNDGSYNVGIGYEANGSTNAETYNTYIGTRSAGASTQGSYNTFAGGYSGYYNKSNRNVIIGDSTGLMHSTGDLNTYIGAFAQKGAIGDTTIDSLRNSAAIGANSVVTARNKMILGDTLVWVGVGLSNDRTGRRGPSNSLEIDARDNSGTEVSGSSGLRFRQLKSIATAGASNGKVLTVNDSGDVVLVKDSIGSGGGPGIHACGSSAANYIPFFYPNDTTLCNSIIYQDTANGRIGISTTTPGCKLDVFGAINIPLGTDTADSYRIGGHPWMWTNGISNTFLGYQAGNAIPSGGINTFIGVNAGYNTTSGYNNTYLGYSTGFNNTTGQDNVSIGEYAGYANKTGSYNISIGTEAAQNDSSSGNVIIGHNAGVSTQNTGTTYNVFVGEEAGSYNGTGISNTYMGGQSGTVNSVSGSYNTLLGYGTNLGHDSLKYATAIGSNATIYSSYAISLGQSGSNSNPGFGNTTVLIGYNTVPSVLPDTTVLLYVNSANVAGGQSAYFNGHCYSTGWFSSSDAKLKTNVQDIQDANTVLDKITAKSFRFDQTDYPSLHLPSGSHYGVIAQDVEAVMPSAVQTVVSPPVVDSIGNVITPSVSFKAVNYSELIPLLMASNKQQRQAIDSLQSQLTQLQTTVSNCCASSSGTGARMMAAPSTSGTVIPVDLHNAILLEQNSPNPFAEHTTINYNVGSEIQSAQIVFFDNTGRILKSVVITERGPGMLDVYAGDLSSGMYSYSLIADGQVLDTKKMVRMK